MQSNTGPNRPSQARLPALGTETTAIIHENLAIVLTFVFSGRALNDYRGWLVARRWHFSDFVLSELPAQRAKRAIIELAVMFRALDDVKSITTDPYVATHPDVVYASDEMLYGTLYSRDGAVSPLPLREVSNKIIHAASIDWDFANPSDPIAVCIASTADASYGWTKATIRITRFAAVCGALASS